MQSDNHLKVFFNEKVIDKIVNETFSMFSDDSKCINYENYKVLIQKYPRILNWLKVDLDKIKSIKDDSSNTFKCFN